MKTGRTGILLISAGIIGIITAVMAACMFDIMKVQSDSMEPSIYNGSKVVISRMAYFFGKPKPGDVVAFSCEVYSEDEEGSILLRRVAASEGDKVEIRDGNLYVNGKLYEGYESNGVYLDPMEETTVGKNRVFVVSDTGLAVLDSRNQAVGQLRKDELQGKVLFK